MHLGPVGHVGSKTHRAYRLDTIKGLISKTSSLISSLASLLQLSTPIYPYMQPAQSSQSCEQFPLHIQVCTADVILFFHYSKGHQPFSRSHYHIVNSLHLFIKKPFLKQNHKITLLFQC